MHASNEYEETLRKALESKGFAICVPFKVAHYNEKVPTFPLPDLIQQKKEGGMDCYTKSSIGFVIGTTFTLWPPFLDYVRQEISHGRALVPSPTTDDGTLCGRERGTEWQPVDDYCRSTVEAILSKPPFSQIDHEVRYSWHTPSSPSQYVHIQTAAHVSGEFYYDKETFWCAHREYGLWFALRAVVVLGVPFEREDPAEALPVLSAEEKAEMKQLTEKAKQEGWTKVDTLLQIRDTCSVGKQSFRYPHDQLSYFYPPQGQNRRYVLHQTLNKT